MDGDDKWTERLEVGCGCLMLVLVALGWISWLILGAAIGAAVWKLLS
jgi:hypothetical protein